MSSRRRISLFLSHSLFPRISPVIPAKAGIHKSANNLAIRNQAPSATDKSPLPLREMASARVTRAMRARRPRSQGATDR